jgi:beta-phosphoglucomutase
MDIKAAIFDLDGTVLDNEPIYANAFSAVLQSQNVHPPTDYPHTGGIGVKQNWINFVNKYKLKNVSIEKLAAQTQLEYLKHINEVHVREGFHDLIYDLNNNEVKTALATSNERNLTIKVLNKFAIRDLFSVVITVDDVEREKPDPESFKKAQELLGVSTNECVVFEDSQSGIKAAKLLNMKTVGIKNRDDIDLSEADLVVHGFIDLNYEKLELMLQ